MVARKRKNVAQQMDSQTDYITVKLRSVIKKPRHCCSSIKNNPPVNTAMFAFLAHFRAVRSTHFQQSFTVNNELMPALSQR